MVRPAEWFGPLETRQIHQDMRAFLTFTVLFSGLVATAQYGAFDAASVKAAKNTTTIVVLDAGDSPYNRAMMDAVKNHWRFTGSHEFVTTAELATQPISPEKTYLMKVAKVDPVKFEGVFLALVKGWKPKKGDMMEQKDNAYTNIPAPQELAYIMIDAKGMNEHNTAGLVNVYLKHLQDYLGLVETGKITDKTTADRTYSGRTRFVRETELWMAREHLDKTVPDAAKLKEFYTAPVQVMALSQLLSAVEKQDRAITISDVVITGDHKNKHCFKRVFNAGTGELMYQNDDAAIYGKKEGFIDEDLKNLERAR